MKYIKTEDISLFLKDNILSDLTEENLNILDQYERNAIGLVDSYISNRYDTEWEYKQTNNARNQLLVSIMVDIIIYNIETRMSTDIMSELRDQRYNNAIK